MLKAFDSIYFKGKSHFEEDRTQNYLVCQPMCRYIKKAVRVGTGNYIYFWKSKGLVDDNITAPNTSDYMLNLQLSILGTKTRLEFRGSCLKQDKIVSFNHGKVVNTYIVYKLDKIYVKTNPTLVMCLFGAVCVTKNADTDKYKYFGYGIGFDRRGAYLLPSSRFNRNLMIFGVDMSSSVHVDDKGKDVLILGRCPTQGLGEHSLTA